MYCKLTLIAVFLLSTAAQVEFCRQNKDVPMNDQLLTVSVKCKDNPECLFEGEDIFLEIKITNRHNAVVEFPLEYVKDKGPVIKMIDTRTKREIYIPTHPADPELINKYTGIRPGESVVIEYVIYKTELVRFSSPSETPKRSLPFVDVTLEIIIKTDIRTGDDTLEFYGSDSVRVRSKVT